jgi:hypothetical protein
MEKKMFKIGDKVRCIEAVDNYIEVGDILILIDVEVRTDREGYWLGFDLTDTDMDESEEILEGAANWPSHRFEPYVEQTALFYHEENHV